MTKGRIPDIYRGRPALSAEAIEVLGERRDAIIGTLNADGTVHLTPVWFLFEDGLIYFETNSATRKARNAADRGVASALIASDRLDVIGMGTARVIGGEQAQTINRRLRAKYVTEAGQDPVGRFYEAIDDVTVELSPTNWVSWDGVVASERFRSLPEYSKEAAAGWFHPRDD